MPESNNAPRPAPAPADRQRSRLAGQASTDAIVRVALDALVELMNAPAAALYLLDEELGEARLAQSTPLPPAVREQLHRLPLTGASQLAVALDTGEVQVVRAGAGGAAGEPDPARELLALPGVAAVAFQPLAVGDRRLGAVVLGLAAARADGAEDLAALARVAEVAAAALDHARLEAAASRRYREAELLTAIVTLASGEDDLRHILSITLDRLSRLIPFTGGSIAIVEGDELVMRAAMGPFADEVRGQRQRRGPGRSWQIVESGEPFFCHDLAAAGYAVAGRTGELGIRSYLAVPLRWRDRSFGLLEVDSPRARAFRQRDLDLLQAVAAALSGPIELARRYTEEQAARQRLGRLAAERTAILGQITDGVIIADPAGHIVFVNAAAQRLHGHAPLDIHVRDYADAYHVRAATGEAFAPEATPLARAALFGETIVDAEWQIIRPDGREIVAQGSATPVVAEDGARLGAVLTTRDVTVQRHTDRQKVEFLSTVSHDLKNPLVTIKGLAQLLRRRALRLGTPDGEWIAERLSLIDESGNRMSSMLNELVDVARLQLGQPLRLQLRLTDLVTLVGRTVEGHQKIVDRHRLRLEPALPELMLRVDSFRLERVLLNLLSNAVKYSPDGGDIVVRVWQTGSAPDGLAHVSVQDHGVGIPAADLPHILERFHRGENVARHIAGSGIGLAGAQQIVEQHGGHISVDSQEGSGATFTVTLPLTPPPEAAPPEA